MSRMLFKCPNLCTVSDYEKRCPRCKQMTQYVDTFKTDTEISAAVGDMQRDKTGQRDVPSYEDVLRQGKYQV